MRISDWSSDVCSSDLIAPERRCDRGIGKAKRAAGGDRGGRVLSVVRPLEVGPVRLTPEDTAIDMEPAVDHLHAVARAAGGRHLGQLGADVAGDPAGLEIGRASCREKVCQYV